MLTIDRVVPAVLTAAFVLVSTRGLSRELHIDEGWLRSLTDLPLGDVFEVVIRRELSGGLNNILLTVSGLGGASPGTMRLPALLAMTASISVLWKALRLVTSAAAATLGLTLYASNLLVIEQATFARHYGLFALATTVTTWQLLRIADAPGRRKALVYGLFCAVLLLSHFFGALVLVAHATWILFERRSAFRSFLWAAVPLAPVASLFVAFVLNGGFQQSQLPAGAPVTPGVYFSTVMNVLYGQGDGRRLPQAVFLVTSAIFAVLARRRVLRGTPLLGALMVAIPLAVVAVLSRSEPSIVNARYLVCVLPGLALLVGSSLQPRASWRYLPAAVLVALNAAFIEPATRDAPRTWRQTTSYLASRVSPNDVVITLTPFEAHVANYYLEAADLPVGGSPPSNAQEMLRASGYLPQTCPRAVRGDIWIVSTMTRSHKAAAATMGRCASRTVIGPAAVPFFIYRLQR
jgi:hypothetical protein